MRIMYFLAHPGGIGGASNVMLKHAHMMKNVGHDVCVVIQNDEDDHHSHDFDLICERYGVKADQAIYPVSTCIEEIDIDGVINAIEELTGIINSFSPDIVHSLQINTAVELACRKLGIPHVMSIYPLSEGMFNIRWDDVLPKYVVGDSLYYSKQWGEGLGAEWKCIRVSYNNEHNKCEATSSSRSKYEFLCIGVLISYKNQLEIIKFIEILKQRGIDSHLNILGDDSSEYGRKCREYVSEHNLEDNISFRGFVFNIEQYMQGADALIHVSKKESYPGVIVEAMANGLPVMITPIAGIPELVKDGENGLFVFGHSAEDIFDSFNRFVEIRNDKSISKIINNGLKTYEIYHSEEVIQSELEIFYKGIIDESDCGTKFEMNKSILHELHKFKFEKMSCYTRRHIWFLWHIKRIVDEFGYKSAFVWGAGHYGTYAIEWCRVLGISPIGFIDSNKTGEYMGYPILRSNDVHWQTADVVFVAIADIDACRIVSEKLESYGMMRNKNYFLLENNPCI